MVKALFMVAFGILLGIGLIIYLASRVDRCSGCFYSLFMALDVMLAVVVLIAYLEL
jgi:hypothetical protein